LNQSIIRFCFHEIINNNIKCLGNNRNDIIKQEQILQESIVVTIGCKSAAVLYRIICDFKETKKMGRLLCCFRRILLAAILGLLVCFEGPRTKSARNGSMLAVALSMPRRPPRIRPKRQSTLATNQELKDTSTTTTTTTTPENNKHQQALGDPSLLTEIRFSERTDLHPHTKEALRNGFGLETMTVVQAATYEAAVSGTSILAKSKTGSGKTLAFLLPIVERLVNDSAFIPGRSIGGLVLAPTRELAIQIADQAEILVDYHNHNRSQKTLKVACIYGGVKMQRDVRLLTGDRQGGGTGDLPTLLVSTPSRLLEHLEGNSPLQKNFRDVRGKGSKSRFATILAQTKIVVLDETDRLLQKSNLKETQKVLGYLARTEKRQTLLFSATFPRAVRRLLLSPGSSILGKTSDSKNQSDFLEVDCYEQNEKEASDGSNQKRIEESFVNLEKMSQFIPTLLTIIRREQQRDSQNYKILVFFSCGTPSPIFVSVFYDWGPRETRTHLGNPFPNVAVESGTGQQLLPNRPQGNSPFERCFGTWIGLPRCFTGGTDGSSVQRSGLRPPHRTDGPSGKGWKEPIGLVAL